jgi:tRNA-binding protein
VGGPATARSRLRSLAGGTGAPAGRASAAPQGATITAVASHQAAGSSGPPGSPGSAASRAPGAPPPAATGPVSRDSVTPDEFFRADIRVGRIVRADEFPQARNPAYRLWIDFGELGTRTSSAQLTAFYQAADLAGRLVLAVVNFPPRRVAGFSSEVLVLGVPAPDERHVALVQPDRAVPQGTRVF